MLIRVMGDPHGLVDLEEDGYWLTQADQPMCTGDFGYHIQGKAREEARQVMEHFHNWKVATIFGNHDGINHRPSLVYGKVEAEPAVQKELINALGSYNLGYAKLELNRLTVIGGRPFSNGNPGIQHPPYGKREITVRESADLILKNISESDSDHILILSHNGPKGLGQETDSPYGRDWKKEGGDWGDEDLALVLQEFPQDKRLIAVVTGHMHHRLRGGGLRPRVSLYGDVPIINAAVVPRVVKKGSLDARPYLGEAKRKKVFQEHRHFTDIELDDTDAKLISVSDFWARRGNRQGEGVRLELYKPT